MAASGGSTRQLDDLVEAAESEDLAAASGVGGQEHRRAAEDDPGCGWRRLQYLTCSTHHQHSAALSSLPAAPKIWQAESCATVEHLQTCCKRSTQKASYPSEAWIHTPPTVASSRDKALVRNVARSIVSVSSISLDGRVILQCTGIVFGLNETTKCARILTSSDTVCGLDHKPKLLIRLPNRVVLEGQLLFINEHYEIALLEISSESDLPLQLTTFGSNPNYGQEVFALARGKEANLMARRGKIKWFEEPDYLERNYLMFLDCELPQDGTGGPVVDHDGNVTGMTFDNGGPNVTILAISIILTCVEMWTKFSCIARPIHGLCLRTMELLEVSLQEVISLDHNINSGYIVDKLNLFSLCVAEAILRYIVDVRSYCNSFEQSRYQLSLLLISLALDMEM